MSTIDFYYMLYTICIQSTLCSEQYYLDNSVFAGSSAYGGDTPKVSINKQKKSKYTVTVSNMNFKKFVYQISLTQLFIIHDYNHNNTVTTDVDNDYIRTQDTLILLEDKIPIEWIPHYIIVLNSNDTSYYDQCHVTMDLYSQENQGFIHSTQYLLHVYSRYVRNDFRCKHFNEWLVIGKDNRPHCECKHGKSCDTESTYKILIIVLSIILILIVIIYTVSLFTNSAKLMKKIDATNKLKYKQQ